MSNVIGHSITYFIYVHIKYLRIFHFYLFLFNICRENEKIDLHKLTPLAREIEDKSTR